MKKVNVILFIMTMLNVILLTMLINTTKAGAWEQNYKLKVNMTAYYFTDKQCYIYAINETTQQTFRIKVDEKSFDQTSKKYLGKYILANVENCYTHNTTDDYIESWCLAR